MKYPKRNETSKTGGDGVTSLQTAIESFGWIFRRQDGDDDFGYDAEIEIVEDYQVMGLLIKAQIKSSKEIKIKNGKASVQIKTTTYNMWQNAPLPTIIFYVDTSMNKIYWRSPISVVPRVGAGSVSIHFESRNTLEPNGTKLKSFLNSWFKSSSSQTVFNEVSHYWEEFERMKESIDVYDAWMDIDDEISGQFRRFYGHVLRLRAAVGLSNVQLLKLSDWDMRSEGVWPGLDNLSWAVFSEAIHYINFFYKEAVELMCKKLKGRETTVDNQHLMNFVRFMSGEHTRFTIHDSRSSDNSFHTYIENELNKLGVLKYPYKK